MIFGAFFIYYFVNAFAPEISPDGSGYHLGNVVRIWRNHGFDWNYHSMYSYFSQGLEMLFVVAFSFGHHSAAALVHFAFLCTLPLLMVCWGRRFGFPRVALFAALLVYASPVVAKDGTSAYNDLAVATLIYAVFYLLQVWDEEQSTNLLYLIGLLSGAAYASKYTAFLTLPFALGWVLWRGDRGKFFQVARILAGPAGLIGGAVGAAELVLAGQSDRALLGNAWFPNPFYHAGMERIYAESLAHYTDLKHDWQIPLQLTLRGGFVGGMFGPVFLLAPLALLALRLEYGRRLLATALVFAAPAYLNTGSRFLIPCASVSGHGDGYGTRATAGRAPGPWAMFQALVCWPPVLSTYGDMWNWRISQFPLSVALRRTPVEPYLLRELGDLALKGPIEASVPPQARRSSASPGDPKLTSIGTLWSVLRIDPGQSHPTTSYDRAAGAPSDL